MFRRLLKWLGYIPIETFDEKCRLLEVARADVKTFKELAYKFESQVNNLKDEAKLQSILLQDKNKEIQQLKEAVEYDSIRNRMGSIDWKDVTDPMEDMDESERAHYTQTIFGYREILKKEIQWLLKEQIEYWARNSVGGYFTSIEQQTIFSRGNVNFADLLLERMENLKNEHVEAIQEQREKIEEGKNPKPPLSSESSFDMINLVNGVEI